MKQRLITGSMLVLMVAAFLLLQTVLAQLFDIFVGLVSVLCAIEFSNLLTKMGKPNNKNIAISYAVALCVVNILFVTLGFTAIYLFITDIALMLILFAVDYLLAITVYRNDLNTDTFKVSTGMTLNRFALYKSANTLFAMLYPSLLFAFMYLINHFGHIGFRGINASLNGVNLGLMGILLVFAIASMSDTLAYIFGSMIRGPKLCPKISPNKTISGAAFGLVGGMIGAVVVYIIFAAIFPALGMKLWWKYLIIGFFGSAISQLGDIFESYLKRKANVKDTSNILPGHGGVLDRVDAICFNTLFVFICMMLVLA